MILHRGVQPAVIRGLSRIQFKWISVSSVFAVLVLLPFLLYYVKTSLILSFFLSHPHKSFSGSFLTINFMRNCLVLRIFPVQFSNSLWGHSLRFYLSHSRSHTCIISLPFTLTLFPGLPLPWPITVSIYFSKTFFSAFYSYYLFLSLPYSLSFWFSL